MTVREFAEKSGFRVLHIGEGAAETVITEPYCCDLLSIAMTRVPEGAAWVTVMSNINTLAVASLTEAACVILAENAAVEESLVEKAREQGIHMLHTELPVFEAALIVYKALQGGEGV